MFQNRSEAGMLLASRLRKYQNIPGVLLAVPRGGVPVAYEVAKELNMPLELILVKKLGHPSNPEYAIGAVGLNDSYIVPHADVTDFYITSQIQKVRTKLQEMKKKFMGDKDPEELKGKTVIVIDDGVATGNTLLATIRILRKSKPAKIVVAVPVASKSAVQLLSNEVDELIAVLIPETFYGVGRFYDDFKQVEDEEVIYLLNKLPEIREAG
ncbi:MAG: phosphoribosyltransferase [Flavisolibacter sp.]